LCCSSSVPLFSAVVSLGLLSCCLFCSVSCLLLVTGSSLGLFCGLFSWLFFCWLFVSLTKGVCVVHLLCLLVCPVWLLLWCPRSWTARWCHSVPVEHNTIIYSIVVPVPLVVPLGVSSSSLFSIKCCGVLPVVGSASLFCCCVVSCLSLLLC